MAFLDFAKDAGKAYTNFVVGASPLNVPGWQPFKESSFDTQIGKSVGGNFIPKYTDVTDALALAVGHSYIGRVKL